jgi:hypothetical protein
MPTVYLDALTVLNRACARIGNEPLQSPDEATPGGQAASLIYDGVVSFLLGMYPFSWALAFRQLEKLPGVTPLAGYAFAYQLPGDRLGPPLYVTDDPSNDSVRVLRFRLLGDQVHSSAEPLYVEIPVATAPEQWSSTFLEAVTLLLASELSVPLSDDDKRREALRTNAIGTADMNGRGGVLGMAIAQDARATPPRKLRGEVAPLLQAWQS